MAIKKLKPPTEKQRRLILGIKDNLKARHPKSKHTLLKEAGYTEPTQKQPSRILSSPVIKDALEEELALIRKIKKRALQHITEKKLKETRASDLAHIGERMEKMEVLVGVRKQQKAGGEIAVSVDI